MVQFALNSKNAKLGDNMFKSHFKSCLVAFILPGIMLMAGAPAQAGQPEKELIAVLDLKGVQASEGEVAALTD